MKANLSGLFPDIFCYFFDTDGRELGAPPRICQNPAPGLEHNECSADMCGMLAGGLTSDFPLYLDR